MFILKRLIAKAQVANKGVTFQEPLLARGYLDAQLRAPNKLFIPFLIFTDLHMPQMNGFELISWIRSQPLLKDTAVVMLTNSEDRGDAQRAVTAGADKYLAKFPTASVLREVLHGAGASFH